MKPLRFTAALLSMMFFLTTAAAAQGRFDGYFALGTAQAESSNQRISYTGSASDYTPGMGGVFGTLGADYMLTPSLGFGGELSFRFAQMDYASYGMRPIIFDFNGIWTPKISETVMPELQAGLGGVSFRFYGGQPYYDYYTGTYTNYQGSSNHFQLHVAAGLRFYVREHVFLRPQIDYRWVNNLQEFAGNSIVAYSVAVGFSY